ncbi:hypothetical protein GCM10009555_076470 [Acrocarpospora macrocephala]|uniref:ATP-grasp domain-containing protein n=1 Tax=Acrocarpospora macrocephala TaxID=150177 RepID=A0A5M3WWQ0_9ACTN|nr:hypothetical protein Amac_064130 [Acrocarpospora macrocephala]
MLQACQTMRREPRLRPHIVIINRWRERYADYAGYLDHRVNRVSYITTEVGLASVPQAANDVLLVAATDDLESVRRRLRELVSRYGKPDAIIALKEDDLLVAAALRAEWDCPGQRAEELIGFRDKYVMSRLIARAGLPVPAFGLAADAQQVADFAAVHGWPVIVKPRCGSSSEGVVQASEPADLVGVSFEEPLLVQEYNPNPIYHVDGVFTAPGLVQCRASRYVNTCLGFRSGSFLGSVEEDDPVVNSVIAAAAEKYMSALTNRPTAFHLEVFVDSAGPSCVFLEVGARVGGAEIPFVWREVHGYDLMEAAFRIQLGLPVAEGPPTPARGGVGGWLLIPTPLTRPCRITEATSMVGRRPGPYAEALLRPGEVLPLADAYYEHVGGRFRFCESSSHAVEQAIVATAAAFRVAAEPIELVTSG